MQRIQITPAHKTRLTGMIITLLSLALFISNPIAGAHAHADGAQKEQVNKTQQSLQSFVGQWYTHAGALTVRDDGTATFMARSYTKCGAGVPAPCDTWNGNLIIPGINENIAIHDAGETSAHGIITSSTDGQQGKPVTMTLQPQDTLLFNDWLLCGPKAPTGYCGA